MFNVIIEIFNFFDNIACIIACQQIVDPWNNCCSCSTELLWASYSVIQIFSYSELLIQLFLFRFAWDSFFRNWVSLLYKLYNNCIERQQTDVGTMKTSAACERSKQDSRPGRAGSARGALPARPGLLSCLVGGRSCSVSNRLSWSSVCSRLVLFRGSL